MTSRSLDKAYKTPFSIHCKVQNGLITYMLVKTPENMGIKLRLLTRYGLVHGRYIRHW